MTPAPSPHFIHCPACSWQIAIYSTRPLDATRDLQRRLNDHRRYGCKAQR